MSLFRKFKMWYKKRPNYDSAVETLNAQAPFFYICREPTKDGYEYVVYLSYRDKVVREKIPREDLGDKTRISEKGWHMMNLLIGP